MDGMTVQQAFFIGIIFSISLFWLFYMIINIYKFRNDRNDCEIVGHKYCKLAFKQPIFYEIQNLGSEYEFLHLYCYCKRCGQKIEYPFMLHKETDENIRLMSVAGYDKFYKAVEEGDNK